MRIHRSHLGAASVLIGLGLALVPGGPAGATSASAPTVGDSSHQVCLVDLSGQQPDGCFGNLQQGLAWLSGDASVASWQGTPAAITDRYAKTKQATTARPNHSAGTVHPDGYGGTPTSASGGDYLALVCQAEFCPPGTRQEAYYTGNFSYRKCTHVYPNDDYFHWHSISNVGFQSYHRAGGANDDNCNAVILYPGSQEQGTGAINVGVSGSYDSTTSYNSISWSNRT